MLNITSDKDVITALSMPHSEGHDVELLGCKFNHVVFQKAGVKTYDDALGFIRRVRNSIKQSNLRGEASMA